ncbi:hypothetical protein BAE44_0004794, partial [Dichanthelium oligosanthes]
LQTRKMASSSSDFLTSGAAGSTTTTTKPLTMFYNGSVAVFHLPQDKVHELYISVYLWFFDLYNVLNPMTLVQQACIG